MTTPIVRDPVREIGREVQAQPLTARGIADAALAADEARVYGARDDAGGGCELAAQGGPLRVRAGPFVGVWDPWVQLAATRPVARKRGRLVRPVDAAPLLAFADASKAKRRARREAGQCALYPAHALRAGVGPTRPGAVDRATDVATLTRDIGRRNHQSTLWLDREFGVAAAAGKYAR